MNWYFFGWRDVIEVIFFSSCFYYFSIWLSKDKKNNLVSYFYLYSFILLGAYQLQLSTITALLCIASPIIIMLFIIMHQQVLQRNFVALRAATTSQQNSDAWLETLIRSCLVALNHTKEILCVIEYKDNMRDFMGTTLELNIKLNDGVLDLIIESNLYNTKKFIWCTTQGQLTAINAEWNIPYQHITIHDEAHKLPQWQQDALIITSNTDAIVMKSNVSSHTFTLMIKGTMYTDVDPHNTLKLIQQYLRSKTISAYQGAQYHGTQKSQKYSVDQSHH